MKDTILVTSLGHPDLACVSQLRYQCIQSAPSYLTSGIEDIVDIFLAPHPEAC